MITRTEVAAAQERAKKMMGGGGDCVDAGGTGGD